MERDSSCAPSSTGEELLARLGEGKTLPLGIHLQIADRCNHACVHCYQVQGQKGELTFEQLCALLDGLAAAGVLLLSISGGESTLRTDLLDIARYARGLGFAIRLYTNGFNLSDELVDALAAIGLLEVHVSVYSDREAEHDAVTRVPGSLARTLAGIGRLRARGMRVCMKSPALALAPGATRRLAALAEALGCEFVPSTTITPREDGSLETMDTAASNEALAGEGLLPPWLPGADDAAARAAKLGAASCGVATGGLVVLPNGDVLPCSDTPVPLGNLARESLGAILEQNADAALLRQVTYGDLHGCRACDLLLACSRCHATALRQGGDYLGPYEEACARSRARYALGLGRPVDVLAPDPGCTPGRSPSLGPYQIEAEGVLRPVRDVTEPDDDRRAARHPWLRSATVDADRSLEFAAGAPMVPVNRLLRRASVRRA